MKYQIGEIDQTEYKNVVEVWESSVRATHHFLKEEDILNFKPLILNEYLDAVELRCIRNAQKEIVGFSGVAKSNMEMLFVHPDYSNQGIGKALLKYSLENQSVRKVDVNEQNKPAMLFYLHHGFKVVDRSELDGTGKPYPILHLELNN